MTAVVRERGRAEIDLPWTAPPLNLNQRLHWAQRARITRDVRHRTAWLVRAARVPAVAHVIVGLHWRPPDNRIRDTDNLVATLKVCADAVVDAGVVPDDRPVHMGKYMPVIHPADKTRGPRLWLEIEWEPEPP